MKRAMTLLLAVVAGLLLSGILMAVIVPAARGRVGPATGVVVALGCVASTVAAAVFVKRRD
jgi:hypothetical protein